MAGILIGTQAQESPGVNLISGESADVDPGAGPVYAVQILADVDSITATGTLNTATASGFSGFRMEGSDSDGYDVFRDGLHYREALALEYAMLQAGVILPNPMPPGFFVVEADNLR